MLIGKPMLVIPPNQYPLEMSWSSRSNLNRFQAGSPMTTGNDKDRESYLRWQEIALVQLGYTINFDPHVGWCDGGVRPENCFRTPYSVSMPRTLSILCRDTTPRA